MPLTREQIAKSAAQKLAAANVSNTSALLGLDGVVDEIIALVDKRTSLENWQPIKTIADFGQKVLAAAGQSSNYELVVRQMKLGGNGPIMANALASIGLKVTYIGNLGYPSLHAVFQEMAGRSRIISIAEPGHTDALEFEDGKLMLGKITPLADVNWNSLMQRVGLAQLTQMVDESSLLGLVNWTMLLHMNEIWTHLQSDVLPKVSRKPRKLFIDLADPEKRTHDDIVQGLRILARFQSSLDVMLGLNLKESSEIAHVLDISVPTDAESAIEKTAAAIRQKLNIYCCVIHPRGSAAAATEKSSAQIAGPFVQQPKISTGAGDHFNAGFSLGQTLGFTLEESLCVGVGTSGYYVRSGMSPTARQLAEFVANLPPPQA